MATVERTCGRIAGRERALAKSSCAYYNGKGRILARRCAPHAPNYRTSGLSSSRRAFLQSLSRSALVLSFENVLAAARPAWARMRGAGQRATAENAPPPQTPAGVTSSLTGIEPLKPGTPLNVSFLNVAKE